jgi:hypothetical protein
MKIKTQADYDKLIAEHSKAIDNGAVTLEVSVTKEASSRAPAKARSIALPHNITFKVVLAVLCLAYPILEPFAIAWLFYDMLYTRN